MFEKYDKIIDIEQVIKDKYNYSNLKELHNQKFIELESIGKDALYWINYDDEKYLFKPIENSDYNIWGELLSQEIAKILEIPCAEYRVATLENQKGVITKSFLNNDDTLILGSEIFQKYFNIYSISDILEYIEIPEYIIKKEGSEKQKYLFKYLNNIETVLKIIEKMNIVSQLEIPIVKHHLIKLLIFDMITLQGDRHTNNWGFIKKDNNYSLAPIYDNSASFGLGYPFMENRITNFKSELINARILNDNKRIYELLYQSPPNLTLSEKNIPNIQTIKKDIPPKILSDLLEMLNPYEKKWLNNIIFKLQEITIDTIINNVCINNGINIDEELYVYIATIFELNLKNLVEVINNNKTFKKI